MKSIKNPKDIFYISVIALAFLVAIVLCVRYRNGRTDTGPDHSSVPSLTPKEEKVLVTINIDTIEDGLENMGVLVTQEYYFTQVETYTKEKKILNFINSESGFTYSYDGKVTAGIDFGKVTVTKDEETKTLNVEIPYSELQGTDIDMDSFRIYSEKESLWNSLNIEDYNISMSEFEETAERKAIDSGILERSNDQAKELIRNFITNMPGTEGYTIKFEQRSNPYES